MAGSPSAVSLALAAQIRSGHIAGAAVDVYPTEPRAAGEPFTKIPLTSLVAAGFSRVSEA